MTGMTSPIAMPATIIGLMSGTSADGVDAAMITTNGETLVETHESLFVPYDDALRQQIFAVMRGEGDKYLTARTLTQTHIEAVHQLLAKTQRAVHAVGFHGQTIYHAPEQGITEQIGDARLMARTLGIPVVADFRSNDVRHGGQGAPLVPLYHAALASTLPKPQMVVNIGGVANITWLGEEGSIIAFDCGPGNALLDDWMHRHTGARYDEVGACAAEGFVNEPLLAEWLSRPFFHAPVPKSLDRNQFHDILPALEGASLQDGAATLTAFTAAAIAQAARFAPKRPTKLLITGGGRHNPTLMRLLETRAACAVAPVEAVGWNGDMLEAEAFAYLAARSMLGLPLSLPTTTGVSQPVTGGVFYPV